MLVVQAVQVVLTVTVVPVGRVVRVGEGVTTVTIRPVVRVMRAALSSHQCLVFEQVDLRAARVT